MSARYIDSFDHYFDLGMKWYDFYHATIVSGAGRFGTAGCQIDQDGYLMHYHQDLTTSWTQVDPDLPTWIIGFAYYPTLSENANLIDFCMLPDIDYSQITLSINTDGTFSASSGSISLFTSLRKISMGQWYYLEMKGTCDASAGVVELHVNDTIWATATGVKTQRMTDATHNYVSAIQISGACTPYIDDVYVLGINGNDPQGSTYNNDFWGDTRIEVTNPLSDGTHRDWTPSSGSVGYLMVNSEYPQSTNNVYAYPNYAKETFTMGTNIALPGAMNAIQQSYLVKQSSQSIPLLTTSGSDFFLTGGGWRWGANPRVSAGYANAVWQRYPNGLAAWTDTNFALSEFGFMTTTTSGSL